MKDQSGKLIYLRIKMGISHTLRGQSVVNHIKKVSGLWIEKKYTKTTQIFEYH